MTIFPWLVGGAVAGYAVGRGRRSGRRALDRSAYHELLHAVPHLLFLRHRGKRIRALLRPQESGYSSFADLEELHGEGHVEGLIQIVWSGPRVRAVLVVERRLSAIEGWEFSVNKYERVGGDYVEGDKWFGHPANFLEFLEEEGIEVPDDKANWHQGNRERRVKNALDNRV